VQTATETLQPDPLLAGNDPLTMVEGHGQCMRKILLHLRTLLLACNYGRNERTDQERYSCILYLMQLVNPVISFPHSSLTIPGIS